MAWNKPSNKGQDRDPWGSGNGNNQQDENRPAGGGNRGNKSGPPDLDDLLRKFTQKLNGLLGGGNKQRGSNGNMPSGGRIISIVAAVLVIGWMLTGFYTIKEGELGVVTRFGKFSHLVDPGLNWKPTFIDSMTPVNVETVRELAASGLMLTADENVVRVEMNVQYRVTNPEQYLFNVSKPDNSLLQATDSALRGVVGKYPMDTILTEGRTVIRNDTRRELENTIQPYNMGITLLDVNFQTARPPDEVKDSFDDATASLENEAQYIREAQAEAAEIQPRANGEAQRILQQARAYKARTVLEAQGEVDSFRLLLTEYQAAPQITRERLYIQVMENVLSQTRKVLASDKSNNLLVLPLDQLLKNTAPASSDAGSSGSYSKPAKSSAAASGNQSSNSAAVTFDDIMLQRRQDAQRTTDRR